MIASLPTLALSFSSSTDAVSFLAIGDWGGSSPEDPTTPGQIANGHGMAKLATSLDAKFVMAMGDNFYGAGIKGDDHAKRFKDTFEDAFPEPELMIPWYVIAGNHDHGGNVSAQIAYSQDSSRWNYPDCAPMPLHPLRHVPCTHPLSPAPHARTHPPTHPPPRPSPQTGTRGRRRARAA